MQTTQITLNQLRPGDMVFAENDDANSGAIHGKVLKIYTDAHGVDVTQIQPVDHDGRAYSVRVRTGLFGSIIRIEG
jgi:hypothetical protein